MLLSVWAAFGRIEGCDTRAGDRTFRLHAEMSSMEPDGLEYFHYLNPTGSGRISHYTVPSSTVSPKESFLWLS